MALRRPANPIGWLFAASGLAWSVTIPFDPWVTQLILDHRPLPLAAQVGALVGEFNWAPAIAFGITLPALLVPDGRLRSPRWRPVVAAAVAGPVLGMLGSSFLPGKLEETVVPIDNPFGRTGVVGTVAAVVGFTGLGLWFISMLAALVSLVLRFRASRGTERQQLRWVVAGATGAVAGLVVGIAGAGLTYFAVLCLPVGVAVAVLRYRLWDLDRLVGRTVTYALVTALLVVPYLLILPAATGLAQGSGSLAVAALTLAAAAASQPLRDQVDLTALHAELLGVVDQTMQPTQASLWLRPPGRQVPTGGRTTRAA
jgi:two-component system NarL family sensor kinase